MSSFVQPPAPNQQNLVLPNVGVNPARNQMAAAQIWGTIQSACPDCDISDIQTETNNILRKIYDRREWYGLFVRGQIATQGFTIGGSVNLTEGSPVVQGVGTNWTAAIVGQQFRQGFNSPYYNILGVNAFTQTLTLEMPWASPSYSTSGYYIAQSWYAMGSSIKYIHTARNLLQAWRLRLNYTQQTVDAFDPWRAYVFTPCALIQMPPDANGNYQVELWPVPSVVQPLPFIAAVQPPNLVDDGDALPAAIRADIVVKFGQAWAKTYKGPKWNKYYDAAEANRLRGEAEAELRWMAKADEDLYRQSILYPIENIRLAPDLVGGQGGAYYAINHSIEAGEGVSDWSW